MRKKTGFTLIELLITVAVLTVLLVIGVPQYQRLTSSNRLVSNINTLVADLNLARSEAIKRNLTVTVCGSNDGATCNSAFWETGWLVFSDQDRDGVLDNPTDILLSRHDGLPPGLSLRATLFDNNTRLQYLPNGELRDQDADGFDQGTLRVCDTDAGNLTRARATNINRIGRISVARDTNADNIVNDVTNTNIACP